MSFKFCPIYTGDYLRDTRHLTPTKHGIYLLLLFYAWDQKGPLPLDEQECAGIANCRSADEIESLRYVLRKYFVQMDDGHYNRRMQREVEQSEAISRARSEAGRKGYLTKSQQDLRESQASAKQVLSNCLASAKQVPLPSPSPSHITLTPKEEGANAPTPRKRGSTIPEGFGISAAVREWAVKEGYGEHLDAHLAYFVDYATANRKTYIDWDAALRNAIRGDWGGIRKSRQSAAKPVEAWWATNKGIEQKAAELGIRARGGETWHDLKDRIRAHLAGQAA